ncbi:hypothetical protein MSGX11T_01920 [Mycoplasma synoviae GX11-T]|nr:hypothetical protein [Mycoplasmopsis synoviae GX11-T]
MHLESLLNSLILFNKMARKNKIVFSICGQSLNQLYFSKELQAPFEIALSFENYNKLLFDKNFKTSDYKLNVNDNPLPRFFLDNNEFWINLLIPSETDLVLSSKTKKLIYKINQSSKHQKIISLIDYLNSNNPNTWAYLYFDSASQKLKVKAVYKINPNFYKVIKLNKNLSLPYLNYFEENLK